MDQSGLTGHLGNTSPGDGRQRFAEAGNRRVTAIRPRQTRLLPVDGFSRKSRQTRDVLNGDALSHEIDPFVVKLRSTPMSGLSQQCRVRGGL